MKRHRIAPPTVLCYGFFVLAPLPGHAASRADSSDNKSEPAMQHLQQQGTYATFHEAVQAARYGGLKLWDAEQGDWRRTRR